MIKEFDLDAPSLPKDVRSEFRYQTRALTNLFERCFSEQLTLGKAWKVLVEVVPSITHQRHRDLIGVLTVQVEADPTALLDAGEDDKSELALKWLIQGTDQLAEELGLNKTKFNEAAAEVRSLDYKNIQTWKKSVLSPDGKKQVEIVVEHGIHEARLVGRIRKADGTIIREHVLTSERPDEFIYAPLLGSLTWLDDSTAELKSQVGDRSWRIPVALNS